MRKALLLCSALVAAVPAQAQTKLLQAHAAAATFTGPGDIVASATAWYGLRGYSAAYAATGTGKSVNVRRASDNATQDIVILTSGALDVASANTFAGPDGGTGVCTASTSGSSTTLTISSCATSATLHVKDTLTCASCVQPVYINALGTFSGTGAGASGTVTLNVAQNITSQSVTSQVALFVTKIYDQTVGNLCGGSSCDALQATAGTQPQWHPLCANTGSLPCIVSRDSSVLASANNFTPNASVSVSSDYVANRIVVNAAPYLISENGLNKINFHNTGGWRVVGGAAGTFDFAASDSTWHAINVVASGASSVANNDGSETTGTVTNDATSGAPVFISATAGTDVTYGAEGGFWDNLLFSGTQRTNQCHNARLYWGSPGSC